MRKNKIPGGNIICTISAAALYPHETYPEYDGAKAAVLNFIHATSRLLLRKENIKIGGVLPGIVATNIIPPEMVAAVAPDSLTPVSTIVSAYQKFLDDDSLAGKALEAQVEDHIEVKWPAFLHGRFSERSCTVWEPLFKQYHGENSDLPGALP
jgi:short-subunit dehydrogenase